MTTLHKLSVRGVRSYSPDDESVIKFQHPLTIIVGSNGSGKTTIIECLKYVCSGEFPPLSDKGKSFVHDPDACGEPVVKGQIKLAFRTAAGASVIACKSFQVTAQKGRRTFKLIDSVLSTTDESGATKTCSYKCARMDELMTTLMGVSQPILENVIFCHQLDADWPLSDDKSLKKRFDDIFAATKYTKALENIKKLRAEQTAKVKDMQRDLDILSSNLQTARKIEDDIKQTTSKLESVSAKWTGAKDAKECHTELVERLSGELAQAGTDRVSFQHAVCVCSFPCRQVSSAEANLQSLEREASLMAQEVARARSTLQLEYVEDDDALRTRLAQLEKALEQRSRSVAPCEAELQAATAHEETLSSEYQNAIKAVGRIEVLQEQFDAQMRAARDRMLALSDTYGLGQHVDLSSSRSPLEQAQAFIDALTHVESTLVGECTSAKEAAGRRVGDLERRVNRCAEALSDAVQQERVEQREREHIEKAIADLDVELAVARRQTVALEPLRAQLREAERALQDHVAQVAALDVDKQLECLTRQQNPEETAAAEAALARLRSQLEKLGALRGVFDDLERAQRLVATLVDAERDVESCAQRVADLTRSQTEGAAEPGSVEDAHAAYEAMQNESKDDVRELRQCLGDLRRIGNDLDAQRRIERGTTQLEADVRSARDAVRAAQHRLDTVRAALAQFEVDHRNLSDNVAYRARCAQLEDLHGRVRSLRAQASSARPSSVVQADLDQARQALLQSERDCASCSGAHATLADQLSNSKAMLHEERYRTAAARHRDVTIDLETTRLAVADLDCFYKALDRSLMEFHSIKMREINDVLKDLWQATYRGKDIDTIAIRSDSADGVADVGGPRKQYNYRLVMMQGDTELGMRGRSSAGQRVLASLLIRMALSETFCVRCGILALDEPTTNLDEENVRALADALNALIERRKGHESFQLIVITHDEEFVELLRKRDHADCYWRVFKDTNGCSKIKKIPINA
ncbi:hypothetical protein PBRA_009042 [Plasmodiophora brassicae]|uniref:DNA repair protein RAD50 n=1 Tax=Plasmodiophora brassicae TaxID=37360 RepID=A0A0G4J494_PLABS|nr:hypothetical protein PBRA_009042 [Plasmodiophora brassicae]